jgi:hypothetical protein
MLKEAMVLLQCGEKGEEGKKSKLLLRVKFSHAVKVYVGFIPTAIVCGKISHEDVTVRCKPAPSL